MPVIPTPHQKQRYINDIMAQHRKKLELDFPLDRQVKIILGVDTSVSLAALKTAISDSDKERDKDIAQMEKQDTMETLESETIKIHEKLWKKP